MCCNMSSRSFWCWRRRFISWASAAPDDLLAVVTGITQGLLCAGASVYADQLVKQMKKRE